MKKQQFIKAVLAERPQFSNVDTFFYVSPVDHILSGFLCEMTPNGAYVWRFLYPLFDKFSCLHLTYSYRLPYPDGYIDYEKVEKKELANEFVSRIDQYVDDAYNYLALEQFVAYLDTQEELLSHEQVQKALGYTMILLGDKAKAKEYLGGCVAKLRKPEECQEVMAALDKGLDNAKRLVLDCEFDMEKLLGINRNEKPVP